MVFPAALLAARPNSSLNAPGMAFLAWKKQSFVCLTPSVLRLSGNEEPAACVWAFCTPGIIWVSSAHWSSFRPVSRPLLGFTLRGQTGALRLGVVLLRLRRPCRVSGPPRTTLKAAATNAAQTSSGPRQESTPWHLGAGPTRSLREG
jgi:hypothetical protein